MKSALRIILPLFCSFIFIQAAQANIHVYDYTQEFVDGYHKLKHKNKYNNRKYLLHFELAAQPEISQIFFDGHPVPKDPRIEAILNDSANRLPEIIAAYEQKIPEVKAIVKEVEDRSQKLFGMKINANVVLSTSVSQTDAVTTGDNTSKYATVALNMREMMQYSKDDLRIVLAHELFHVLQHQIEVDHSASDMIAGNLYSEGWATYASSLVYPGFSDWKYISYFNKNDKQFKCFENSKKAIIHDMLHDWNSRNMRKFDKYFSADNYASHPFEPRSGYYIGYLAAKKMAENKPAVQVALIKYDEFKREIKPLLKKMSQVG